MVNHGSFLRDDYPNATTLHKVQQTKSEIAVIMGVTVGSEDIIVRKMVKHFNTRNEDSEDSAYDSPLDFGDKLGTVMNWADIVCNDSTGDQT